VDIHTDRLFRPSYDLINNSLFVHIRIQRYTLKEKKTFFLHCFGDLHCTHVQSAHMHTRDPIVVQCIHHWTYVALV
jgi:hypothetical protein